MSVAAQYIPAAYSLTAVGAWGASDFLGGVGVRRVNAFLFTAIVHGCGLVVVGALALMTHAPFPGTVSLLWSLVAGMLAGVSLVFFYRALACGNMGLIAPVAGGSQCWDSGHRDRVWVGLSGHSAGEWVYSCGHRRLAHLTYRRYCRASGRIGRGRTGGNRLCWLVPLRPSRGQLLGVLASAARSRVGLFCDDGDHRPVRTELPAAPIPVLMIAVVAGILDLAGSVVFIRAAQLGRLDAAVVLSSLYPAVTVVLARIFLHEHFSRAVLSARWPRWPRCR